MTISQQELQNLRQSYKKSTLRKSDGQALPHDQMGLWLKEALQAGCDEPNAFTLATIKDGSPRSRVVLLKSLSAEGLVFFTNYESPKAMELGFGPQAAMNFLWLPLERQVRVEGVVEKVPAAQSDAYFASRPWGSQIGALASPQGQVVESRDWLEKRFAEFAARYPEGTKIPRPSHWGGYLLRPRYWEFWQGRENRLHDRLAYRDVDGTWVKERLAP